jgi:hypothetical protein
MKFYDLLIPLLAVIVIFAKFIDNALLRDVHKKMLLQKFEDWWLVVADYDKLQLALILASKTNDFLDFAFGKSLISKKVLWRGFVISSLLLLATLLSLGILKKQPFGVTPWKNYKESIKATVDMAANIGSFTNYTTFKVLDISTIAPELNNSTNEMLVDVQSNRFLLKVNTNGLVHVDRVFPMGNGELTIGYYREFRVDSWTNSISASTNPFVMMHEDMEHLSQLATSFDKPSLIIIYSVVYFAVFFLTNTFLFVISLATCRVMMREIVSSSGRILSMTALVFTNVVIVFCLCCVLLLLFTILAVPFLWLFVPILLVLSGDSIYTLATYLIPACIGLWFVMGASAKIAMLIAFLPSILAGIVGFLTLLAVKFRKQFHYVIAEILIRFVEKEPLAFFITVVAFVTMLLVGIVDHFHFTEFL